MAKITWTYTVTNSATSAAIKEVNVWATSDRGGQTVLDGPDATNASGLVTFSLEENSEVYIWTAKSGYGADAQPDNETVTALAGGSGTMTAIVDPVPESVALTYTCRDLISDALMECGILAQGETASSEDSQFAFRRLNNMIDQWKLVRRYCLRISIDRYTLTASQTTHKIGPSGDFLTDRPDRIVKANIVVTGITPELHNPVRIIESAEEWGNVSTPGLYSSIPSHLYCDYGYPDATLYLWPIPDTAYDLELFTWKPVDSFKSIDDSLVLQAGYYDAIMYSLAERLCGPFGIPGDIRQSIFVNADRARAAISKHNIKAPLISLRDAGIPNTESF